MRHALAMESEELRPDIVLHRHRNRRPPNVRDADELSINTTSAMAIDAVGAARSGHPGTRWPWRRSSTCCSPAS